MKIFREKTVARERKRNSFRFFAGVTAFIFCWNQIVFASGQDLTGTYPRTPISSVAEIPDAGLAGDVIPSPATSGTKTVISTSTQFLNDTLTLTPTSLAANKIILENRSELNYEYERYAFEDAFDLLREDYASAVIVKEMTAADLERLVRQPFETGILVLHGEIVLITSGSEDEIGILAAARDLARQASFVAHTHTSAESREGPSGEDINEAGGSPLREEYVITHSGVYAYDGTGLLNYGGSLSYETLAAKIGEAIEFSRPDRDQVAARRELNRFIAEQDAYNSAAEEDRATFRMGGTISSAPKLKSTSVTALPGSPWPYLMAGSSAATSLSYNPSTRQMNLNYSVPGASDVSGFTISFDDPNTSAVETQNMSVLTNLVFGLKGTAASIKFEIIDANNVKDDFTLTGVSNKTEKFWRVPVASILNALDKTRVKAINFIVTQANATSTTRTGTVSIRSYGLNTSAPSQPAITSTVPVFTNQTVLALNGMKEANTAIFINGVQVVARDGTTTWTAAVNLTAEGKNTFNITAKNSIGLSSTVKTFTVQRDTVVPTGSINIDSGATYATTTAVMLNLSGTDSGSGINAMSFSTDNVNWTAPEAYAVSKIFTLPSGDGSKTIYIRYYDKAGNVSAVYSKNIILDTIPPAIVFTSPSYSNATAYHLVYTVDGVERTEDRELSAKGENLLNVTAVDAAGNASQATYAVNYCPDTLEDGTRFVFENGNLRQEITPAGDSIFYGVSGRTERFVFSDGREVSYVDQAPYSIVIKNADGSAVKEITPVTFSEPDVQDAVSVTLGDGSNVYYKDGAMVEVRTPAGARVFNITFTPSNDILEAVILYPDGSREVIWGGKLLRRIEPDGSFTDRLPSGLIVREVAGPLVQYYQFTKISQTNIQSTRIFTGNGAYSVYDELGILRETGDGQGTKYFFSRTAEGELYRTRLQPELSGTPQDRTWVESLYTRAGELKEAWLQNGMRLYFFEGRMTRAVDSLGNEVDYSWLEGAGSPQGLQVSRGSTTFSYDDSGFLQKIATGDGAITRVQEDTDGDGEITGEDVIQLILDTVSGYRLTDFELDPQGNILRGILELRNGIKQYIQDGVVTSFETADGRTYQYRDQEALLTEWNFRDGTRVLYGGGAISEILFPDGRRLDRIGFNDEHAIDTYAETLADGTQKFFAGDRLVRLITPQNIEIRYDATGRAFSIRFSDLAEQSISYQEDEAGNIQKIIFQAEGDQHVYAPDGSLIRLLTQGVGVEMQNGEIRRLFTRFGEVNAPQFDPNGILSGEVDLVDGTRLVLDGGEVRQAVKPDGTIVTYADGTVTAVDIGGRHYEIVYQRDSVGVLQNVTLRYEEEGTVTETALIPYLLAHPDPGLADIFFPRPLENTLEDRADIQSEMGTEDVFFSQWTSDPFRGTAYEFGNNYFPEWARLSLYSNQGFISQGITLGSGFPSMTTELLDIDGDGLPDRVFVETSTQTWWFQKNTGQGFADPQIWTGAQPLPHGTLSSAALESCQSSYPYTTVKLIDMNGDGLPDRVLQGTDGSQQWYVQMNNGQGFDPMKLWDGKVQVLPWASSLAAYAMEVRSDQRELRQELVADLIDLDGDGLPDRVLRPSVAPFDHWFFQKNNGHGFEDAVLWEGVDLSNHADAGIAGSLEWYHTWINGVVGAQATAGYFNAPDYDASRRQQWTDAYLASISGCSIYGDPGCYNAGYRIGFYSQHDLFDVIGVQTKLADMNGDGLTDRLLLKKENANDSNAVFNWYVQFNNGKGFDASVLWSGNVRNIPNSYTVYNGNPDPDYMTSVAAATSRSLVQNDPQIGASIRIINGWGYPRNIMADLVDVTGDGLPDRVSVNSADFRETVHSTWWVEVNNGQGFDPAVAWAGIYGQNENETVIGQDTEAENFHTWPVGLRTSPGSVRSKSSLADINGDKIPDRVIYSQSQGKWLVQFGTGHGFLPVREMNVGSLKTSTTGISSSHYDYLHVSLRAQSAIFATQGSVKITLGDPAHSESYQEWTVSDLKTLWKDFYLPIDKSKSNADQVRIRFVPAAGNTGAVPIYTDNITFTAFRPPDAKGWLDHLLTEENTLTRVHSVSAQTLAQYIGLTEAVAGSVPLDWDRLLQAETRVHFDPAGEADQFQTLYGSISRIENGHVTQTTLPDGTRVDFSAPDEAASKMTTQQVIYDSGISETFSLAYGRVRSVSRLGASALEYSYEFDDAGEEITVVRDPDSGVVERYRDRIVDGRSQSMLISRTNANGVQTIFEYDEKGRLIRSSVLYQGRVRETFLHSLSADGHPVITTEAGVQEEYAADGTILFHTTPEGYRYGHTFEPAKQVVVTDQTVTEMLPDGTFFTVQIPQVQLEDDPQGERVQLVTLLSYRDQNGYFAAYGTDAASGAYVLQSLRSDDGAHITFDRIEITEVTDPQTGEVHSEVQLRDVTIFYGDGTITEYRDGKPFVVISAAGRRISLLTEEGPDGEDLLIDPSEAAAFHLRQSQDLWDDFVLSKWDQYKLPGTLPVKSEYTLSGELRVAQYAEGTVELYSEEGKIEQVLSPDGERLILYHYDEDGELVDVDMEGSRRRLESAILNLRANVSVEREKALAMIAAREQVLSQTLEGAYVLKRDQLLALRARIEAQREQIVSLEVKNKKGKGMVADAMAQIQAGIDQVNAALERLAGQRQDALRQLAAQVQEASLRIETESQNAYDDINGKADEVRHSILKQEIMPVVYRWHRKILGRDPNKAEYDAVVATADYATGTFDLEGLKNNLLTGSEFLARTAEVNAIKAGVVAELQRLLTLSEEARVAYAAGLGIPVSEVISLSPDYVQAMCQWIGKQPLHFGQSAFLALEALIRQQTVDYRPETQRVALALQLILTDILTGTLTPLEQGDLLISTFAMRLVAKQYSVDVTSYAMSYDVLRGLYSDACGLQSEVCGLRVVVYISGNHYVIVTKVTDQEVTYIDPGAGPEDALGAITIAKEDFLKIWINPEAGVSGTPEDGFGYVLSARPPPASLSISAYHVLITAEQMSVRGAFFPFLVFAVMAVVTAIQAVVSAIVTAITAIVGSLVAGITSIAGGFGAFISGIFSGNFLAGIGGLFQGVLTGIGQIAGGVFSGIVQLGQGLIGAFAGLNGSFVGAISQGLGHSGFFGTALPGFFQSGFFTGALHMGFIGLELQGAGTLLDVIGVSPKITRTLISGGQLALGISMLATGNPYGVSFAAGGTSELLNSYTDLSPTLSGIIGIGAAAVGTFASSGFDGGSLAGAISGFRSALPYLSMDLASAGLTALGSTLDWSPVLTGLIGIPVRATIGGWVQGVSTSRSVLSSIQSTIFDRELLGGMASIGFSLASEKLDLNPLFSALGLRLATAGFIGAMNPNQTIVSSMAEAFLRSSERLNPFADGTLASPEDLAFYFEQAVDFVSVARERGIVNALEFYAANIFQRDAIESIFDQGGLADILAGRAEYTVLNEIPVKVIHVDANNDLYFSSTDDSLLLGRRIGNQVERGTFVVGPDGRFLLKEGVVETTFADGLRVMLEVWNGAAHGYRVFAEDKALFEIYATGGNQIALRPDGTIYSAVFINKVTGARLEFFEGQLVSLTMPATSGQNLSLSGMSLAKLTSIQQQALVSFVASNGIWNTRPEGVPPDYEINLMNRLVERGVDPSGILLVPLYENGDPVTDSLSWIVDALGGDQLTHELMNKLDQKWVTLTEAQRAAGVTAVMYSGSTNPFLKALDQRDYNVSTVIALGSPTLEGVFSDGTIDNPNVRRVINIYGENDFVPLAGGNKYFTGPDGSPIENINIKILGADHFDYFPAPDGSNKVGEFILKLTEVAGDADKLISLLNKQGVTRKEDGSYEVDPNLL
ncbi:MAG: VCBS repeat-containing protein, partial [Candidatus Omnitrophica bacterium]|nr:VCBS repeat-containing protein [Candidatus Omnitrophota bacterium]